MEIKSTRVYLRHIFGVNQKLMADIVADMKYIRNKMII